MDLGDIIALSHEYGTEEFALAGGGNTSVKDREILAIKASGVSLRDIDESGFVLLRREAVEAIMSRSHSSDPLIREAEVKRDLLASRLDLERGGRPSVESSLHGLIRWRHVVHTHPYAVNALLCAREANRWIKELFVDQALVVGPTDPGYTLAMRLQEGLASWRRNHVDDPHVVLMLNHGLVVAADTAREVRSITDGLMQTIRARLPSLPDLTTLDVPAAAVEILPALRMLLSGEGGVKVASLRLSALHQLFFQPGDLDGALLPFTPDQIVYCGTTPLVAPFEGDPKRFLESLQRLLEDYKRQWGGMPRVVLAPQLGVIGVDGTWHSVGACLDLFDERLKISFLSRVFGGPRFLSGEAIRFIESWEVENYRRSVATSGGHGRVEGKVVVVTGAAQGFGKGIAEGLFAEGANVAIADLNEEAGSALARRLNDRGGKNGAIFVRTDVTDPASLSALAVAVVSSFGGLDLLVSNAGILRAGGIEEISPEAFDLVTRVNYTGYFLCVRTFAPILRLQRRYRPGYLTDIVQVNSKSGLQGSNRNSAYAGGKFGGIGLTQSFALELVGDGVKVNAVCPGNYFEGPLWSDPENGLFVQYLRAGKVPGARTIEEVRRFYESKVPMGRGCRPEDLVRAILYLVEQEYETGQALAVTGGQVMLG